MDLFGNHMRMVLRNQIQRESLQITATGKPTTNPLLRDTGGFTLPGGGGSWSLPRTGWGLTDGGYSSENKQIKEQLTGGLTEVPDRHQQTAATNEAADAADELGAANEEAGESQPATPGGSKVAAAARRSATRVDGSSRAVGGTAEAGLTSAQKAAASAARRRQPDAGDSALDKLIRENPGKPWVGTTKQPMYLLQKARETNIQALQKKAHLLEAFGGRGRYKTLHEAFSKSEVHPHGKVFVLNNGDRVAAYHKDSYPSIAEKTVLYARDQEASLRSAQRVAKRQAKRKKKTKADQATNDLLPAADLSIRQPNFGIGAEGI